MPRFDVFLWICINWILGYASATCTPQYGPNNVVCRYLPAPPGKTPRCARPGYTYCEYPDHYPVERIYLLIHKWQFNHQSLIIDEAKDDFNAMFFPPPNSLYGPSPSTTESNDGYHYPEPIYISKPAQVFPEQGGLYLPPEPAAAHNFTAWNIEGYPGGYVPRNGEFLTYKYTSNIPAASNTAHFNPPTTYYVNDVLKRNDRLKRILRKRRSTLSSLSSNQSRIRAKRQSAIQGRPLCRSRSSFIMPKAALNSRGNWMYIVNTAETNQQYTQLVKSEMCVDSNCGGLCQLPQGYSSRCEQKYVQKRLIALDASGSDLYSDTFWFPSCCVCTVSNN